MNVTKPTITNTAGNYRLDFSDEKITVQLDRISENSKFETSGEITITSRIPGNVGHVHRARLNLTSSPTRKSMGKVLEEKIPGIGWDEILEYVCVMVLDNTVKERRPSNWQITPCPKGWSFVLGQTYKNVNQPCSLERATQASHGWQFYGVCLYASA